MSIGQVLPNEEAGWKRYLHNGSPFISYVGGWNVQATPTDYWCHQAYEVGASVRFNFQGTKLRIIGITFPNYCEATICVDGKKYPFNGEGKIEFQVVLFEILNLKDGLHSVEITQTSKGKGGDGISIEAIDIDVHRGLAIYSPVEPPTDPTDKALLCITMTDSSEHKYELDRKEISEFIAWFKNTAGDKEPCYRFDKQVGSQTSQEYLTFQKIISFEVK